MSEGMRKDVRSDAAVLLGLLIGGVLLAVVWRVIDPATAKLGDNEETAAAVDGTLALLGVLAGFLTGAFVVVRPGNRPLLRTLVAVAGSALAGLIAWKLGDVFGKPALRAEGSAFTWPVATCVAVFAGSLLPWSATTLNRSADEAAALSWQADRSGRVAPAAGWTDGGYPPAGAFAAPAPSSNGHGGPAPAPNAFGGGPGSGSTIGSSTGSSAGSPAEPDDESGRDRPPWRAPGE